MMDVSGRDAGCEDSRWLDLAQDCVQRQVLVLMVPKCRILLSSFDVWVQQREVYYFSTDLLKSELLQSQTRLPSGHHVCSMGDLRVLWR